MTLPLSRFALALALAATATLGVVAQTPEDSAAEAPAADAEQAVDSAAETASDAAPPAEPPPPAEPTAPADAAAEVPEVPAEPQPVAEASVAEEPVVEEPIAEEPVVEVAERAEPVEASVIVNSTPPTAEPLPTEVVAQHAPAPAGPVCWPINVLDYRTTLSAKRAYRCYGPGVNTAVCVDNPADCLATLYEVPLCVPACCTGVPRVCNPTTGLLGRGKVDLVWECGFTATVVFRAHGGAIVIYQG